MIRSVRVVALVLAASAPLMVSPAEAVELAAHRAIYSFSLGSAKPDGGVVAASGGMVEETGETCDGWTEEQRFRLRVQYAEQGTVEIKSTVLFWESKDGRRYRYDVRRDRSGEEPEVIKGEARLEPDKGGTAEFTRPQAVTLTLAPGVLFPTAFTRLLLERAAAGESFVARQVFDGSEVGNADQVTAVIGPALPPGPGKARTKLPESPLLERRSWRIRLAFFVTESADGKPDYEESIRLLDNGVTQEQVFDYGDYTVNATLDHIEPLPRPSC